MAISNFQDVIILSSDTLNAGVERVVIGSSAGSKSIVFAQDPAFASAMHLAASNPTAARTAILPDANGTAGLITAVSASGAAVTNGQIVFSNSNEIKFGLNGSTITAGLTHISNLEIGGPYRLLETFMQTLYRTSAVVSSSVHTQTLTMGTATGIRVSIVYPIDVTYIDPYGEQNMTISGNVGSGTWTISASLICWCGLYTINGSTAGVISSASAQQTLSKSGGANVSTSTGVDPRFTNITWNVTPGDYMFFTGQIMSISASISAATANASIRGTDNFSFPGLSCMEVSYSVPYWEDGSVSVSATSYHLSQLSNSGGTAGSTVRPWLRLIGT